MNNESKIIIEPTIQEEKQESIQMVNQENKEDISKQEEDFVTGLPEWDLTPPYEVVRRVNRK